MKKIFILFYNSDQKSAEEYPCIEKLEKVMEKLFIEGKSRGVEFYRAHINWFNLKDKNFTKCWKFEEGKWSLVSGVQPDIVFDRCPYSLKLRNIKIEISSCFRFVNNPYFDEIVSNKYSTYLLLHEWMPKTFLVGSQAELKKKIDVGDNCEKFVLKPLDGYGGSGVVFFDKETAINVNVEKHSILQEFIDNKAGIKGVVDSNHDLRILIFRKEIFGAYVRIPRSGCLCANVSLGGKRKVIRKEEIPSQVLSIIYRVVDIFRDFDDSFYSIDFVLNEKQIPFILELNSRPGLVSTEDGNKVFFDAYLVRVIEYLKELA